MAARSWREARIDDLLAAVSELGMTMSRAAAGELLDERVQFVANQMRVTPATARTYLTEEALAGMARQIVFGFVEETPGADLMRAPRTSAVPVRFLGRVVAGLGEVQRILMVERDDLEHTRDRVAQIAHTQSHLGLLLTDQVATIDFYDEPSVQMPPALLLRVARSLATAADLVESGPWWATRRTPRRARGSPRLSGATSTSCARWPARSRDRDRDRRARLDPVRHGSGDPAWPPRGAGALRGGGSSRCGSSASRSPRVA